MSAAAIVSAACIAAAAGLGAGVFQRLSARSRRERWLAALVPLAALALFGRFLAVVANAAYQNWNASRLAPALIVLQGHPLYASLDSGAINEFMYGPVAALAYTPAVLMPSPALALFAAALITLLIFFGSMAWLHRSDSSLRGVLAAASFLCFCLAAFHLQSLAHAGGAIHADAPALGLSACACGCVLRRDGRAMDPMLVLAALLAALAVWSKQTLAPVIPALLVYVWLADGTRRALRFAAVLLAVGVLASAIFVAVFGFDGLFLNMFAIPSQVGWKSDHLGSRWISTIGSLRRLAGEIGWPLVVIALATFLDRNRPRGVKEFVRGRSWTLLLLVALFELPASVSGGAKIGGAANSHAPTSYFLLGAATLSVGRAATGASRVAGAAAIALAVALAGLTALELGESATSGRVGEAASRLSGWETSPFEAAAAFARLHPGEAYFPVTPLVSLYTERALYHNYLGILDRLLAGYETSADRVRKHVPPDLRYVIFPRDQSAPPFLPGYNRRIRVANLPGWVVFGEGRKRSRIP